MQDRLVKDIINSTKKKVDGDAGKITAKDLYNVLVHLINNNESITWNRFNSFLFFNSILILAWANVLTSELHPELALLTLAAIGILGITAGILWAKLGKRGRAFVKLYFDQASEIENNGKCWPKELAEYKPFSIGKMVRDSSDSYASSFYLLQAAPWAFAVLHAILLLVAFIKLT